MFLHPNQHEKHTFSQHDHKKNRNKFQPYNNSNKENNVTAMVDKVSSYQHIKLYNKTLNVLKSLCNNVVVLMSL